MMVIKAEVSRREPREYALTAGDQEVGALRAGALVLGGYESLEAARAAADAAVPGLIKWYEERWRTLQPTALDTAVDSDMAVFASGTLVGQLLRPGDDAGVAAYGFKLRIPDHLWVATGLGLAQRIYTALGEQIASA